jgi:ferredoxin-NADP reductase
MAMLRHRRRTAPESPMRLVYSVRTAGDVIFAGEVGDETTLTFSRNAPEGWTGHTGRIDKDLIAGTAFDSGWAYVCGSNGFVETATGLLLESGYSPDRIKTERFGTSGG